MRGGSDILLPALVEVRSDFIEEVIRVEEAALGDFVPMNADGQIFGHKSCLDGIDTGFLQRLSPADQIGIAVELTAMGQALRPRKDARNGVGAGAMALLVLAIVASHGAVSSFGFDRTTVRTHQD